jgi:hypothetical protein
VKEVLLGGWFSVGEMRILYMTSYILYYYYLCYVLAENNTCRTVVMSVILPTYYYTIILLYIKLTKRSGKK